MIASFPEHVTLLSVFLDRRTRIIDDIEQRLLNVQGKAAARNRDRADVERVFSACFFAVEGLSRSLSQLKGQLASAHVADGFEPVTLERRSHQLDAVELIFRAYDRWDRHRWPGRNGRLVFAQTLYCVYLLHHLEQLTLRIWDTGNGQAEQRLRHVQSLLDGLNATAGANILVRDARWLIQTAQGPLTRHLQPYFKRKGSLRILARVGAAGPRPNGYGVECPSHTRRRTQCICPARRSVIRRAGVC